MARAGGTTAGAPKSAGRLERVLRTGGFALTAETGPPDSADPAAVLARAGCLEDLVDAVNVLDGAGARAHLSPLATAAILARAGIEPVLQFTMRDRNRLALQADALGAAALGVHNLLCLTGDPPEAGDEPAAKPVFDLTAGAFMTLVRAMRDEAVLPGGRALEAAPRLLIGGADAPREPPAGADGRLDPVALHRVDAELDLAVAQEDARAGFDLVGERQVGAANREPAAVLRGRGIFAGDQVDAVVAGELAAVGDFADAYLRALQVAEDGDRLARFGLRGADGLGGRGP